MRWLLTVLFCTLAFSASAEQQHRVTVRVHLDADGVHAAYELDHAVTRFAFAQADVVRDEDVSVLTPGLALANDAVSSATPFSRFEILVKPFVRERDAKYPVFFRVGDGGVLYVPTIRGDASWRTTLVISSARGHTWRPPGTINPDGSLYLGPESYITTESGADIISAPNNPSALRTQVTHDVATAMALYTERLHVALPTRPVIVIAQGGDGSGFVGDVTPGPVTSLRFYGTPEDQMRPENADRVMKFVMHEAFHFWNGSYVHNADGTPSWLHEGSADYAALLGSMAAGNLNDAGMSAALGNALYRCREALQQQHDVGMDELQFLSMNVRYPCGVVIQWTASLSAAKNGHGDFFDIWSHMITAARARPDHAFTLADFYTAAGVDPNATQSPIYLLTKGHGPERWPQVVASLQSLGAEIHSAPTPETRRTALIFHLLAQVCGNGSRGFSLNNDVLTLDGNETCGILKGAPRLTSIEDVDALAPTEAAYAAAQAHCAAGQPVRLVLDGHPVDAPCHAPLPNAPSDYIVTRWR